MMGSSSKNFSQEGINYRERLLRQEESQLDVYDPFESPPNLVKAQRHHSGMSIGIPVLETGAIKDIEVCPCCQNPINKQGLSICCKEQDLLFLGVGYPLYFKLAKYITYMILLVFLISGSGLYYLLTNNHGQEGLNFFGFTIIDFQIEEKDAKTVEFMNMLTAIIMFGFVIYIKSLINHDISELEAKVVCPSQYTIMLQNLPKNYEEFQLRKWIKQTFNHECISINIAYNIHELENAYQKRNNSTIELRKLLIKRSHAISTELKFSSQHTLSSHFIPDENLQYDKQKQLTEEIEKYDRVIYQYKNNLVDSDKNGTAFVTFQNVTTVVELLEKYQELEVVSLFYSTIATLMRGKMLQFKGRVVKVSRAPAPREVIWENLGYSHMRSLGFQLFFMISMLLLIYFAFQYQYKFSSYAYELRKQSKQSGNRLLLFQAIIASLMVIGVNSLLRIIIWIFTKLKRYHSHTSQQSSFCFYYTLMYVLNSCFMIYAVHGQYPSETNQLLLYDIHIILLANAFSEPLFKLVDPIMWHKIIWKRYISSLTPQKNPYTQMYVHKYFEGHQISNGDNYQYIARILLVTIWFAHPAPLGVIFCLIGMALDYWLGKILLLRVYKKPENISKSIANFIINSFQLLPLVYICGVLQFTYKSTSSQKSILQFLMNFFNYSITVSVLIISILSYLIFFKTKITVIPKTPYSQIKNCFGFNYQTQNPITKFRGEISYLQNIMKSLKGGAWMNVHSKEDLQMINELSMNASSPEGMTKMRAEMAKIKIRMQNSTDLNDSDDDIGIEMCDMSDKDKLKGSDQLRYTLSSNSDKAKNDMHSSETTQLKKEKYFIRRTRSIFV